MTRTQSLLERRDRVFGAGSTLFYETPLEIVRGEGAALFDAAGRRYVDLYNNVPCVGHGNARVVEAMRRAQGTLNVHSRYLHEGTVAFAERYLALAPPGIDHVVFSCSGTEANEVALGIARLATGRRGILCCASAYHGNSSLVAQLTEVDPDRPVHVDVRSFPVPDPDRLPTGTSREQAASWFLERAFAALDQLCQGPAGLAALLVCPILANEGTPDIPAGFWPALADRVRRAGGLVIADEVQAGYGRTGTWWGHELAGLRPDIVVTGKPMGNGLPLAATAAGAELVARFRTQSQYFNTCASSPLQAAVGLAVLDEIAEHGLVARAATLGTWLRAELGRRVGRWPGVGSVRGHGLFINVEIVDPADGRTPDRVLARRAVEALVAEGFLTYTNGPRSTQVKIRPPLVVGRDDLEAFLAAFDRVMDRLHG